VNCYSHDSTRAARLSPSLLLTPTSAMNQPDRFAQHVLGDDELPCVIAAQRD